MLVRKYIITNRWFDEHKILKLPVAIDYDLLRSLHCETSRRLVDSSSVQGGQTDGPVTISGDYAETPATSHQIPGPEPEPEQDNHISRIGTFATALNHF